jgi:hypothetical protein
MEKAITIQMHPERRVSHVYGLHVIRKPCIVFLICFFIMCC